MVVLWFLLFCMIYTEKKSVDTIFYICYNGISETRDTKKEPNMYIIMLVDKRNKDISYIENRFTLTKNKKSAGEYLSFASAETVLKYYNYENYETFIMNLKSGKTTKYPENGYIIMLIDKETKRYITDSNEPLTIIKKHAKKYKSFGEAANRLRRTMINSSVPYIINLENNDTTDFEQYETVGGFLPKEKKQEFVLTTTCGENSCKLRKDCLAKKEKRYLNAVHKQYFKYNNNYCYFTTILECAATFQTYEEALICKEKNTHFDCQIIDKETGRYKDSKITASELHAYKDMKETTKKYNEVCKLPVNIKLPGFIADPIIMKLSDLQPSEFQGGFDMAIEKEYAVEVKCSNCGRLCDTRMFVCIYSYKELMKDDSLICGMCGFVTKNDKEVIMKFATREEAWVCIHKILKYKRIEDAWVVQVDTLTEKTNEESKMSKKLFLLQAVVKDAETGDMVDTVEDVEVVLANDKEQAERQALGSKEQFECEEGQYVDYVAAPFFGRQV